MTPTLIGMFQSGKFLPPQLNLVLELEFAEPADALRPGGGSTDYAIENVRVLASQVTLDSALYESYQKILLSGRSLVFAYPTMHTQVSSIPAGSTSHNVTVARAFTKLLGAFVSFLPSNLAFRNFWPVALQVVHRSGKQLAALVHGRPSWLNLCFWIQPPRC